MQPRRATRKPSTGYVPLPNRRGSSRRFIAVVGALFIFAIIYLLATTSSVPTSPIPRPSVKDLSEKAHQAVDKFHRVPLPKLYNPWETASHEPPPEQENSSHGDTKWYSSLKWLQHGFSSVVTLDENRAVLPPLPHRVPIYTYYDTSGQKDARTIEAEHELLLTWRRAWWAQGFQPVVLGHPEAAKHELYAKIKDTALDSSLKVDIERWLAWAHMGGGILANWLVLPMGSHDDPTLDFLRRGEFSQITSYKGVKSGLLAGTKQHINAAAEQALSNPNLKKYTSLFDAVDPKALNIIPDQHGLAYYDMPTITASYKVIANQLTSQSQASGLKLLHQLINAHLHTTFQDVFPSGIAVLQPYPAQTHALVSYAAHLAHSLIQCPSSPMPDSCPPNRQNCKYCSSYASKLPLTTPPTFQNRSGQFLIGTVPHPYTFTSLLYKRDVLTPKFIRRDTLRDVWTAAATKELLGTELGGPQRLPRIKEAIAGTYAQSRSVWVTPEMSEGDQEEVSWDWIFGFSLPGNKPSSGAKEHAKGEGRGAKASEEETDWAGHGSHPHEHAAVAGKGSSVPKDTPSVHDLEEEYRRFAMAKEALKKKMRPEVELVEAWNMADAEVWRFARALEARRTVERRRWEEEERRFAGSERRAEGWGSWLLGD